MSDKSGNSGLTKREPFHATTPESLGMGRNENTGKPISPGSAAGGKSKKK